MARCKKNRYCRSLEEEVIFKPQGVPLSELEIIDVEIDEFEAVRLCDYEEKSQIEASQLMKISRGTIQRLLNSGRKKILEALVYQQGLKIKNTHLEYTNEIQEMRDMSEKVLKIGFGTDDGITVGEHFGHCEKFVIFTLEDKNVVKKEVLPAPEHAPGVFPRFVAENRLDTVIVGTMGHKAYDMITANGTEIFLGIEGNIEEVLKTYIAGELESKGTACHHHHHHEEGHKCQHN